MRKLRVIVCGVGFGRYYIEAILRLPDLFELVGILSRGSKNSIKLAEKYGVPLMTDIEEISKENVDAVCVVVKSSIVGGNGTDIVMQLLEKGIHVIQEQPIHSEEYKKCLIIAKKNHCKYQLNHDIAKSMRNISNLLKPNGIFLMTELTEGTYLQDITAALLEKGFSSISDERRNRNQILPDWKLWKKGKSWR